MTQRPLYHRLDPLLSRWSGSSPPRKSSFLVEPALSRATPLTKIRMARSSFGRELMPVHAWAIGDTLIDTGLSCFSRELSAFAKLAGIRRALLTHHHEDHSGNAATLASHGVEVSASAPTAAIVSRGFPIRFYQHLMWGTAPAAPLSSIAPLPTTTQVGPYEAQLLPAPGHCDDQIVVFIPEHGWLFSGDVFLHERIKVFRRDEDFATSVATLERLLTLDFDTLLCAHRPRFTGGKAALAAKLAHLQDVKGRTRTLHEKGLPEAQIAQRLGIAKPSTFTRITLGDVSTENLVRSILHGPSPRPEIASLR